MIDEEPELRTRFEELRAEDERWFPRFHPVPRQWRFVPRRLIAVAASLFLLAATVTTVVTIRLSRTTFSDSDRVAVRSIAAWRPPTEFLLRTPGSEILMTTPVISDVAGIFESTEKGASR